MSIDSHSLILPTLACLFERQPALDVLILSKNVHRSLSSHCWSRTSASLRSEALKSSEQRYIWSLIEIELPTLVMLENVKNLFLSSLLFLLVTLAIKRLATLQVVSFFLLLQAALQVNNLAVREGKHLSKEKGILENQLDKVHLHAWMNMNHSCYPNPPYKSSV